MQKPKLALVGLGKIAVDQHIPSLRDTGTFELAAIVSTRSATVPGVPTFRTQADLFAALPDIAAVANCLPPHVRHASAMEAIGAGKHLLIEKPPTASVAELAEMEAAARKARVTLFATWHSQYNTGVDRARAILKRRPPKAVAVTWREDVRHWHPGQDWVWAPGGFGVFDPGINALSIVTRIMPHPVFVSSADLTFPANRATPVTAALSLRGPAGSALTRFTCDFHWLQEGEQTWTIAVELDDGGTLTLTHGGTRLFVDGKPVTGEPDTEYRRIYRRFRDLIDKRRSDVDAAPLRLVADAFLIGKRTTGPAFDW